MKYMKLCIFVKSPVTKKFPGLSVWSLITAMSANAKS